MASRIGHRSGEAITSSKRQSPQHGDRLPAPLHGSRRHVLVVFLAFAAVLVPATAAGGAALAPVVIPTVTGTLGNNGWYTSNVTVSWSFYDPTGFPITSFSGCDPRTFTSDTAGRRLTCTVGNAAAETTAVTVTLRIDKTPPRVHAPSADTAPASSGWYTRPVMFTYNGSDSTSGIESCSSVPYDGPDSETATVAGTCRDRAGNVGGPLAFAFKYDATTPALAWATAEAGDRSAILRWQPAEDTVFTEITRSLAGSEGPPALVYRGGDALYLDQGLKLRATYRYVLTSYDRAGHSASAAVVLRISALYAPPWGARLLTPPLLAWARVSRARYYNVQVYRVRNVQSTRSSRASSPLRKILSAWPSRARFQLAPSWRYNGRRFRLTPGRYRWYVWPGFGKRAEQRYGKLLGKSEFVVSARG